MQKFIILVLLALLGTGAYLSKPTDPKKAFADYLVDKAAQGDKEVLTGSWDAAQAQQYADSCEYSDWYFWVNVKHDGNPICASVFNRWFNRGEIRHEIQQIKQKADTEISETKEEVQKYGRVPKSNIFQP